MNNVSALEKEVKQLRQEVTELRRYVGFDLVDPEGEYRPEFVKKMLHLLRQPVKKAELIEFISPDDFVRQVKES